MLIRLLDVLRFWPWNVRQSIAAVDHLHKYVSIGAALAPVRTYCVIALVMLSVIDAK